ARRRRNLDPREFLIQHLHAIAGVQLGGGIEIAPGAAPDINIVAGDLAFIGKGRLRGRLGECRRMKRENEHERVKNAQSLAHGSPRTLRGFEKYGSSQLGYGTDWGA